MDSVLQHRANDFVKQHRANSAMRRISFNIHQDDDLFVAENRYLNLRGYGRTRDLAIKNFREVLSAKIQYYRKADNTDLSESQLEQKQCIMRLCYEKTDYPLWEARVREEHLGKGVSEEAQKLSDCQ